MGRRSSLKAGLSPFVYLFSSWGCGAAVARLDGIEKAGGSIPPSSRFSLRENLEQ